MRYLIFLIIIYSVYPGLNLSAQNPDIAWVKKVGGSGEDAANAITTDAAGNIYVTGKFKATVDFDPGTAVHNLSSFKLTQAVYFNGQCRWVEQVTMSPMQ